MTAQSLLTAMEAKSPATTQVLRSVYGDDANLLEDRRQAYVQLLREACSAFDADGEIVISRAPGRVNLMGRHVDHRGGFCNPIALNLEVLLAAQPRDDDRFVLRNCDPDYTPREFVLGDELPAHKLDELAEWDDWTLERLRLREQEGTARHWTVYVQAAAVNFQDLSRSADGSLAPAFRGMNAVVLGNVPASAGLSSSSAIFVSSAEAILHLAGVTYEAGEFADHCGRGEWYVGTRGGSGDHAAMKYGKRGRISHIGFFPSSVAHVDFPPGYRVVIANSWDEAHKAGGARDTFNQRVAAYEFGLLMLQESFPELAPKMERLRDVSPETLGCEEADVYRMLGTLPPRATRAELTEALPSHHRDRLDDLFAAHAEPPDGYRVRDVCLFGVAECLRSRDCFDLLQSADITGFGDFMNVSHDGDRVVTHDHGGSELPFDATVSEADLEGLVRRARDGDPSAALVWQPGGYACSTPRVDRMVDLAKSVPGVVGAQLSGAGLGGCMMALVSQEHADDLLSTLTIQYYQALDLEPAAYVCTPVEGSGVVAFG